MSHIEKNVTLLTRRIFQSHIEKNVTPYKNELKITHVPLLITSGTNNEYINWQNNQVTTIYTCTITAGIQKCFTETDKTHMYLTTKVLTSVIHGHVPFTCLTAYFFCELINSLFLLRIQQILEEQFILF
jgi:hypothetical protein